MSSYLGRYAEHFDLIYRDKGYAAEAAFVHEILGRHLRGKTGRLLDVACGTGSHALAFEKLGYQVEGLDYSEDLLKQASRKAREAGSHARFHPQDMRRFRLEGAPFDAVTCLFDSIGYAQTNEGVVETFKSVRAHLLDSGVFVFEFWHAAAMLRSYEPYRVRTWKMPSGGELLRISESRLDLSKQLCHVTYSLYELGKDGAYEAHRETQSNRYFLLQEMRALLTAGGFELVEQYAGYDQKEPISEATWHIVAVAKKA